MPFVSLLRTKALLIREDRLQATLTIKELLGYSDCIINLLDLKFAS